MKRTISESPGGATAAAIRRIETELFLKLPKDYVAFLLDHNGGVPFPNVFDFRNDEFQQNDEVRYFLGAGTSEDYRDILRMSLAISDRTTPGCVVIADASCGSCVVMSCASSDYGHVYYWNQDQLDADGIVIMSPLADSFTQFVNGLHCGANDGDDSDSQ